MPRKPGCLTVQARPGQAYTPGPGLYGLLRPLWADVKTRPTWHNNTITYSYANIPWSCCPYTPTSSQQIYASQPRRRKLTLSGPAYKMQIHRTINARVCWKSDGGVLYRMLEWFRWVHSLEDEEEANRDSDKKPRSYSYQTGRKQLQEGNGCQIRS